MRLQLFSKLRLIHHGAQVFRQCVPCRMKINKKTVWLTFWFTVYIGVHEKFNELNCCMAAVRFGHAQTGFIAQGGEVRAIESRFWRHQIES